MLDFGQNRWSAPDYLGRSQQRRLLLLVVAAAAVVAAVLCAADPGNWLWLTQLGRKAAAGRQAAVDTRLKPRHAVPAGDSVVVAGSKRPAIPKAGKLLPGVDAKKLAAVRDDTPLGEQELPAMFELLEVARRTGAKALAAASVGTPAFVQLFEQPESFRGQVVTLRGRVHGVFLMPAGDNNLGVDELAQLWLEPENDRSSPIVIQCLDIPKAFPRGSNLNEQVEVTGLYFKRLAYMAADRTMHLAPMLVASGIEWFPPAQPAAGPKQMDWKQLALAVTVALLGAVVLLVFIWPRRRSAEEIVQHPGRHPTSGLEKLDELRHLEIAAETSEALERIAELDRNQKGEL